MSDTPIAQWVEVKSRRWLLDRAREGVKVIIPWPTEANPDPNKPMPTKRGELTQTTANAHGWGIRLPSGSIVDIPPKGFQAFLSVADQSAAKGRRQGA